MSPFHLVIRIVCVCVFKIMLLTFLMGRSCLFFLHYEGISSFQSHPTTSLIGLQCLESTNSSRNGAISEQVKTDAGLGDEGAGPHKTSSVKEKNCFFCPEIWEETLFEEGYKPEIWTVCSGQD